MTGRREKAIGYVRISMDKQDSERQSTEILSYCRKHKLGAPIIVSEIASGKGERPELEAMLERLEKGDRVIAWELSRFTRGGARALFKIIGKILDKGASLIEAKSGTTIDGSVAGETYVFAFGLAARIEGDMISERTKSALRMRKEKGVKLGRPAGVSKLDARRDEIEKYLGLGIDKANIARLLGCSRSTVCAWVKRTKSERRAKAKGGARGRGDGAQTMGAQN